MRLLHPFMPFVTEEIWRQLGGPGSGSSIMVSAWPTADKQLADAETEVQFERFRKVVTYVRTTRADLNVPTDHMMPIVLLVSKDVAIRQFFSEHEHQNWLQALAQVSTVAVREDYHRQKDAIVSLVEGVEVVIPQGGLIDVQDQIQRLQQKVNELNQYVERTAARLSDKQFAEKAPAEVVEQSRKQLSQAQQDLKKYSDYLAIFQS